MPRKKRIKNRRIRHTKKMPNYGFGKHMRYALRTLLSFVYANGHYLTCEAHFSRFSQFIFWIKGFGIRDIRDVTIEHVESYAADVALRVERSSISVAYAHNLISSVNVVMCYFRRDSKLKVTVSNFLPSRNYVRKKAPHVSDKFIGEAVEILKRSDEKRAAALLLLIRHFGLRLREAVLADLERWMEEAEKNGSVTVLDGCKGGRKCVDRKLPINRKAREVLDFAVSVKPESSKNMLDSNESYKVFINRNVKKLRFVLKNCGIINLREIRAYFLIEYFESVTGMPAPVYDKNTLDYEEELCRGYEAVACVAGHYRKNSARPYVG